MCRRSSGGGTVLLGRGCLCYSLVLAFERSPALREIPSSYGAILEVVIEALDQFLPGVRRAGTSDLETGGRKFSGNAQQRKRDHLLHHGTVLYDFDLGQMGRFLRLPARQPQSRERRDHRDFVCNFPARKDAIASALRSAWGAVKARETWPEERVRRLVEQKYGREDWVRRR